MQVNTTVPAQYRPVPDFDLAQKLSRAVDEHLDACWPCGVSPKGCAEGDALAEAWWAAEGLACDEPQIVQVPAMAGPGDFSRF